MRKLGDLQLQNVLVTAEALIVVVADLDQRLQVVEQILRDPILAAQRLPGLGLVSVPLTGESPAPSGEPSDPATRSAARSDSS